MDGVGLFFDLPQNAVSVQIVSDQREEDLAGSGRKWVELFVLAIPKCIDTQYIDERLFSRDFHFATV
jgi:hypothetical protein